MKKNNILSLLMMMLVASVCVTSFTSCGGNDDDDPIAGNPNIGVHRIDVQFDGNFQGKWTAINVFVGVKQDGQITGLYENGKALDINSRVNNWTSTQIRDYSISTENGAAALTATVMLSAPYNVVTTEDVSITMVGYINNKRIYTQVFTLPAGKSIMTVNFSTIDGGKSSYSIDNGEVIE